MQSRIVLLLAMTAFACVPSALALTPHVTVAAGSAGSAAADAAGLDAGAVGLDTGGMAAVDGVPVVDAVPLPELGVPELGLPVTVIDGALESQATGGSKATHRGLGERVQDPTGPELAVAGAAGAATVVVTLHAIGAASLKAFFARPAALLARIGRLALRAAPFLIPLFSRIEGPKVLDNHVRARVNDMVAQEPGLSLEQVRERSGIAWGTAVHHLRKLEEHGMVVSMRQGNRRLFFPANTPASKGRTELAALSDPTARRVATLVSVRPGIAQHELCEKLSMRNPAASKQLGRLAQAGLVMAVRDGRRQLYHPTPVLHDSLGLMAPLPPRIEVKATATLTGALPRQTGVTAV